MPQRLGLSPTGTKSRLTESRTDLRAPSSTVATQPTHRQSSNLNPSATQFIPQPLQSIVTWLSLVALSTSVVLATWWFGAVSPAAKLWVAGLVSFAVALAAVVRLSHRSAATSDSDTRLWRLQAFLIVGWLGWAAFQTLPLPAGLLAWIAPGGSAMAADFADQPQHVLSLVPELTWQTLAWHLVLASAFAAAAGCCVTRRVRLVLLMVLALNMVLLCCWGIVQRSSGTSDLLPGVANTVAGSNPFGSFIYKNSGGAAVVLGIAALAGLLITRVARVFDRRPSGETHSDQSSSYSDDHFAGQGGMSAVLRILRKSWEHGLVLIADPLVVLLGFGLALALAGLASSLSRGAWIGLACGTLLLAGSFAFRNRGQAASLVFVAGTLVVAIALVMFFNTQQQVLVRVDMLDQEVIRRDDRWNHWREGWQAAKAYLPLGAGLGTYGYSSLPFQHNTYDGWYKQAHNQYLETLEESGLPGLLLVVLFMLVTARRIVHLLRSPPNSEAFMWSGVLCLAMVSVAVQAMVDFVITTPANALLLAVLLGASVNVPLVSRSGRRTTERLPEQPRTAQLTLSSSWWNKLRPTWGYTAAFAATCLAVMILWGASDVQRALARTELPPANVAPTLASCQQNIDVLQSLPPAVGRSAEIHRRSAAWHLLQFRSELLLNYCQPTGQAPSVELWNGTNTTQLFGAILAQPTDQQAAARALLVDSPTAATAIEQSFAQLKLAARSNPFVSQVQLALTEQAPLADVDYAPYLKRAARLSSVSSNLLFSSGLLASLAGDVPLMNQLWSQALQMNPRRLVEITSLSLRWQDAEQIVQQLYPASPAVLCSAYHRSDLPLSAAAREQSLERVEELLRADAAELNISEIERLQWLAKAAELKRDWRLAIDYYERLVALNPRAAPIRFQYAQALLNSGDRRGAWTQANTGATLAPADPRSSQLFNQIQQTKPDASTKRSSFR